MNSQIIKFWKSCLPHPWGMSEDELAFVKEVIEEIQNSNGGGSGFKMESQTPEVQATTHR